MSALADRFVGDMSVPILDKVVVEGKAFATLIAADTLEYQKKNKLL